MFIHFWKPTIQVTLGGVCIYYKNYLPVIRRTDLSDLQECIVAEITVDKECFLTCLYRSPSQNDGELETFCSDLTFLLNNINEFQPSYSVLLGDFNAKHSNWCSTDKNNKAGIVLENVTSTAGYNQIINKPTYFTNVSSSCIDLIFASNTTYLTTGIEQSIYDKYHHTQSSNWTYPYHHLIIGNYGIIKKRTLKLCKELSLSLTGIWLSKIKILMKKLKF